MDEQLVQEMLLYYDERAEEYDDVYRGAGPAIRRYADQYQRNTAEVCEFVAGFGHGHLIDVACGTGFWVPHYARNCERFTFVDQSEGMLAGCRRRIEGLGLTDMSCFVQGNVFEVTLEPATYDCALVGFLLSHFAPEQEDAFFAKLKDILKPSAQVMIVDSYWSERRQAGGKKREGEQARILNDGRAFTIYKKYFSESDIEEMLTRRNYSAPLRSCLSRVKREGAG
ncbi:MAG: class I SAM-dependent methyltransferase, partial [Anaerolineae bacterium]|nr:class I SAM-dependent methyltransferase [Anaerolineae bacterium]